MSITAYARSMPDDQLSAPTPGYTMPIERGKIREFARATGGSTQAYLETSMPPIPPTFLRTAAFWHPENAPSLMSGLNLDLSRLLHGEQEFVFFGPPPHAGDRLEVRSRLESVTEKEGRRGGRMRVIVTVEDFTDERGTLVAQGRSTLIETGRVPQ
jgi:N-terminal half of MaoC dehydratase